MEYLHDEDIKRIQSTIVNINILCFMYMLFQVEFLPRFPRKNDFRFVFTFICFVRGSCFIYVICIIYVY